MRRIINQLNMSITTNRTCTLRCKHCYIEPHIFDDKSQMTKETFKLVFDRVRDLYDIDNNLKEIEWEVIGGETTMMPFEWWDEMLPFALDEILSINRYIGSVGSLNFLTNLIYTDQRYTDLFNSYGKHPCFALYTSWEPDTERFGKRNQLFERFKNTLSQIQCDRKTLDIILTKGVIEFGAKQIIETFEPLGINDFSVKMLSPYGSGKNFFEDNMTDFDSMRWFLEDLEKHKSKETKFTPQDEMRSSLYRGTSFQCNGNFKYDISVEPDGVCSFNANQTGAEAALGFRQIHIKDDDWPAKVCFENKAEENAKLTLTHPECETCQYMTFCNAGWYHYKLLSPNKLAPYNAKECPGLKGFWDTQATSIQQQYDRTVYIHTDRVNNAAGQTQEGELEWIKESAIGASYKQYFRSIKKVVAVEMDKKNLFGKTVHERLRFYDDLGIYTTAELHETAEPQELNEILKDIVYQNLSHHIVSEQQWRLLEKTHGECEIFLKIRHVKLTLSAYKNNTLPEEGPIDKYTNPLHEELVRWVIQNPRIGTTKPSRHSSTPLSERSKTYLDTLYQRIAAEQKLAESLNAA